MHREAAAQVLELAHIARPVVRLEHRHGILANGQNDIIAKALIGKAYACGGAREVGGIRQQARFAFLRPTPGHHGERLHQALSYRSLHARDIGHDVPAPQERPDTRFHRAGGHKQIIHTGKIPRGVDEALRHGLRRPGKSGPVATRCNDAQTLHFSRRQAIGR